MPEQEPLAGLLHVSLAVAAEDLRHLRLDLAQGDLQPRLAAVPQPVDKFVIPCNYEEVKPSDWKNYFLCSYFIFQLNMNLTGKIVHFNVMAHIKKVAEFEEIFR